MFVYCVCVFLVGWRDEEKEGEGRGETVQWYPLVFACLKFSHAAIDLEGGKLGGKGKPI